MGWIRQLFSRRRRYDELSETIREHLDEKIADLMDRGMTREQAETAARREFGNVTRIEERSREVWQWPTLESIWTDVRFSLRQLVKSPGLTISALLTLGLGIGATTAVFTIVYAVLFHPLPYRQPDYLVSIQSRTTVGVAAPGPVSYPNFFDWRSRNSVFSQMVAYHDDQFTLHTADGAEHLDGEVVSSDLFSMLGAEPILGRGFLRTEETAGTHVVVLSYDLWRQQLNGDAHIVGRSINLDNNTYTVVGVAPQSFQFPVQNPGVALWTTIAYDANPIGDDPPLTADRSVGTLDVIARLKNGVAISAAQAQMDTLASALAKQYPDTDGRLGGVYITTQLERVMGNTQRPLYVLFGAVGLVLLIASINIAGLLLLRTTERWKELAMRAALGAGRYRVIRQLLTENIVLALLGGVVGLGLCLFCDGFLKELAGDSIPRIAQANVNLHVFAFLALLSVLAAAILSLPAALQIAKADFANSLKAGMSVGTLKQSKLQNGMLVLQIGVGLMLLSGAVFLLSSLLRIESQDIGVSADNVLTFDVGLPQSEVTSGKQAIFYRALLDKLDHTPGVRSAAVAYPLPLTGDQISMAFGIEGRPTSAMNRPRSEMAFVAPDYFKTAGIPLLQGRAFSLADDSNSPPVFIVNKAFADKFFPGVNPVGKRIRGGSSLREIVGVVGNARQSVLNGEPQPIGYLPFYQLSTIPVSVIVHTDLPPRTLESTVRSVVASLAQQAPVYNVRTVRDLLSAQTAGPRMHGIVLGVFAGLALTLIVVGLYGSIAYSVSRRKRDIGIRMALGADRGNVATMILWEAGRVMLLGISLGVLGTFLGSSILRSMLFGVSPAAPWPLLIATLLMIGAGIVAAYIPARRAAAIDPMLALRSE